MTANIKVTFRTMLASLRRVVPLVPWLGLAFIMAAGFFTTAATMIGIGRVRVEHPPAPPTVNDVTQLNPIPVAKIVVPTSTEDIVAAVRSTPGPVSVGGGRYSMGGQTATEGGVQIDMRSFNRVLAFDSLARTITVQAG